MKRFLSIICALALPAIMSAQNGVLEVHPAANPQGKMLTMADAVISRDVLPQAYRYEDAEGQVPPIAFTKADGMYYSDAQGNTHIVAKSEDGQTVYGKSVSRDEFGITTGIFWSPSKGKLAFYRKDNSRVTDFPLLDITTRTGSVHWIKYPMNGMESEYIQVGVYDLASCQTIYLKVNDFAYDQYLTGVTWSPDGRYIYIQVLDRTQKHLHLNQYSALTGKCIRTILTEDNPQYVEPLDPLYFIKGRTDFFIYRTDNRDGFRNLYLCDTLGNIRRLTNVDADVEYIANDGTSVFYTSAEVSPVQNHLFRIDIRNSRIGKAVRLTTEEGWHKIQMSRDCKTFIDEYSSLNVPRVVNKRTSDGKLIRNLLVAKDPLSSYATPEVDLGTVKSADGAFDNYYRLIKPLNFDPHKKYPVILYVYGGPHSQMVQDSWLGQIRMWEMLMAQKGYLVYVQDNRGTSNRGAAFEKAIHDQCGQCEMADQMAGIKMLMSLPYVDPQRIGVHGWSYGGFMTISLMTNYPDIFKVGVAGGPVIDWKWYEVMYGERYMDTQASNPEGFARVSLSGKAKDLKGDLLICQGVLDSTVVCEHSLSFVQECIKNNVQVDYFPYPAAEHNVHGKDRVHLMDKVTAYFDDRL